MVGALNVSLDNQGKVSGLIAHTDRGSQWVEIRTRPEAASAIFEYIEVWYNRRRLHSSLDYQTPKDYELKQSTAA